MMWPSSLIQYIVWETFYNSKFVTNVLETLCHSKFINLETLLKKILEKILKVQFK